MNSPSRTMQEVLDFIKKGKLCSNENIILHALNEDEGNFEKLLNLSLQLAGVGRLNDATHILIKLNNYNNKEVAVLYNLGLIFSITADHESAIACFDEVLKLNPTDVEALINRGASFIDLMNYEQALNDLDLAIKLNPLIAQAWANKGLVLNKLQMHTDAVESYRQALSLRSDYAEAWSNLNIPLRKLRRFDDALISSDKAIQLKPDYAEAWSNKGVTLGELNRYDEALICYDKAIQHKSDYAEAWSNKGVTLGELKRYDEALICYNKAIQLKPDYAEAWSNKGVTLGKLKRYDEALICYNKATQLKPDYAEAWSNKGVTLDELKCYDEALICYEKANQLNPDMDWLPGMMMHTKMLTCSWDGLDESLIELQNQIRLSAKVVPPFVTLSLFDSPQLHQIASSTFADCEYPINATPEFNVRKKNGDRIRIGYYSADFCEHPVAYLLAELIELHSREIFEIHAFSFIPKDSGDTHKRLRKSFDFFHDVGDKTDEEVAELSKKLEIDIAVDLGGYTKYSRTGIFSYRAAPIQLSYLGYLGTMGAKFIDYLIADQILIPQSSQRHYSEKIIYLPSYQVNDSKRKIADKKFTKKELGLPETGFVFCCFNNSYKIMPTTFDSWMRILKSVDDSVLFLYADSAITTENLKKEAVARGVSCDRLVFGGRLDRAEYLARYQNADLFLDTTPYNAGTTASDALWTGLPIITMTGESFPSRMAESILNAISLSELVTTSPREYEALAIELAKNPEKLKAIRAKLEIRRLTAPLFDAPMFTKNIESAYQKIFQRYLTGSLPEHIYIE